MAFAALVLGGCGASSGGPASPPPGPGGTSALSLALDGQPRSGLPGEPLRLSVSLRDGAGGVATNASAVVTVALAGGPAGAALAGTTSRPAANGVASFDDLAVGAAGQGYRLVASASGAASATTEPFDLAWSTSEREAPGSGANDTVAGAEPILSGVPVFGALSSPDDVDVYAFDGRAGQLASLTAYATRLDLAGWDGAPVLRLLGPDGAELQRMGATETGLLAMDHGLARVRLPADGRYHVACEADPAALVTGAYALLVRLEDAPGDAVAEAEGAGATGGDDDRAHAQAIGPGLVEGFYQAPGSAGDDSDVYRIAVASPTRVRVALTASRNGAAGGAPALATAWDGVLSLEDAAGTVLWQNDDTWLLDPSIDYVVTAPGDYFVRVRRFGADPGSSPYLLSYEAVPYAPSAAADGATVGYGQDVTTIFSAPSETRTFAFAGRKGDLVRVWLRDRTHLQGSPVTVDPSLPGTVLLDPAQLPVPTGIAPLASLPPGDSNLNVMQAMLQADGTHFVRFTAGAAPGAFGFMLEKVAAGSPDALSPSGWGAGAVAPGGAGSWTVHADEGQLVTAAVLAGPGGDAGPFSDWGSTLVPSLKVLDPDGQVLATASASRPGAGNFARSVLRPDATVEIAFRAPIAGDYAVVVSDAGGGGGATAVYAIHVEKNR